MQIPPFEAGQGKSNPSRIIKPKRTRLTTKIYADIGNFSTNGSPIEVAIRETGISKYTSLKIYKDHQNMKVVIPKASPPLKGKTS